MDISQALTRLHITALSDMQQHAAEAITRSDGDVVILSPTGSGKTIAYLLPLCQKIDATSDAIQAIVVVPSRELALQTHQVLQQMACGVRSMSCYGGRPAMDEHRQIRSVQPHIVVGTPGRLNDHIGKGNIDIRAVCYLAIDEYDKCLEMGFQPEMQRLVASLTACRQHILLSATPAATEGLRLLGFSSHATTIDECSPVRLSLYAVTSSQRDKLEALHHLLLSRGDESSIVFLNHRDAVERVSEYLRQKGFTVSNLHGGMEQRQREDMLYQFSNGSANILVATDLASRGLDIPEINNVIHYHLPETADNYTHRVGRTARWDATGSVYFILGPDEDIPQYVEDSVEPLELTSTDRLSPPLPRMATVYIGKGRRDRISRGDIVGFLCKTAGLKGSDIGRIDVRERYSYVAVSRPLLPQVLRLAQGQKIKGIKTVVEPLR